ncbi:MAG TPA: hypothetical protein VFT00_09615 [Nocardioides sp.]|nr:hypothetical protein [Nocardioides sp.]
MHVDPISVDRAARSWDEQHLEVAAAAGQIGSAPTSGFTDGVAAAAARFVATWQRDTAELADRAGARADGLRGAMADLLRTDRAVGAEHQLQQDRLPEAG